MRSRRALAPALVALVALVGSAGRVARADDCPTAAERAQSLKRSAHLIEARQALLVCSAPSCAVIVRRDCVAWLAEVDASLPSVVVRARDERAQDVVAARVFVDDVRVRETLDGKPFVLDPGPHRFRFDVPGFDPAPEQTVVVQQGEKNRLVEVTLHAREGRPHAEPPSYTLTYLGVGIGALGLAVGSIGGLVSLSSTSRAKEHCNGDMCRPDARSDLDGAILWANVSNVGFGLAVVGVAIVALSLMSGSPARSARLRYGVGSF